jgi:hypothetical protein
VWSAIFEFQFYSIFILVYLAGLFEISVCPKGFLLWPLVSTEKVESSLLAPGWYKESHIYIIFRFVILWVAIFFWRYGNWKHIFLIRWYYFILLCEVDYQIQNTEYILFTVTLLGYYHPGRPNFLNIFRELAPAYMKNLSLWRS